MNVMICDPKNFRINYVNKSSRETLKLIEHLLPCRGDEIIGQCVDIFHKNPAHQRQILSDPKNLPVHTHISVGDEVLDLNVMALTDARGNYIAPMVTRSIATEALKAIESTDTQSQIINQMPANVLFLEIENLTITYANGTSVKTLRSLQDLLPCKADDLVGQCVDIFHKDPAHRRRILSDPSNLPHTANISLGDELLNLRMCAVSDSDGNYSGVLLTWQVITEKASMVNDFETNVKSVVELLAASATEMQATSEGMAQIASHSSERANTVAAVSEELSASVNEISQQVARSATIASEAIEEAKRSNQMMQGLTQAAQKIGEVVALITDIADQTNLLALNATIEAARAGDAGKGFAVVASEVNNLANKTAKATDEISEQISAIQGATQDSVKAIQGIGKTITEINEIATVISAAVEEQSAATQEVATNITEVTTTSAEAGQAAGEVLQSAGDLARQGEQLGAEVGKFLIQISG